MAEIKLDIYKMDNKKEIEKTYRAESYDLMMGTVEDFIGVIDLENMDSNVEVTKAVVKCVNQLKPLLHDVFEGITDEEIRRVRFKDIIPCLVSVVKASFEALGIMLDENSKN